MWLDQLERDALQTQETGGSLAQQYQVGVFAPFKLGTLGTDVPIMNLISGITQEGSGRSRHISCLAHQSQPLESFHI